LAELLTRRAESVSGAPQVEALARAADVWEGKLQSPDAAAEILEKILAGQPGYVPALTRLARIYEGPADRGKCSETLRRALALNPTGDDAADLYYRLGRVTEAQSGDLGSALPYYEKALSFAPAHADAVAALERAARERGDWRQVAELLARRESVETEPAKRLALAVELAEIHRQRLRPPLEAVPHPPPAPGLPPPRAP